MPVIFESTHRYLQKSEKQRKIQIADVVRHDNNLLPVKRLQIPFHNDPHTQQAKENPAMSL